MINDIKWLWTVWEGQTEWCGKWKCIYAAHVFICPASLCFLFGVFKPITFKVMIDMYSPVTCFSVVLGLFSVDLFLLLCFLPGEVPLAFVVKLVGWCLSSFNFCLFGKLWFLHQIWRRGLLGRVFLVVSASLLSL